MKVYIVRHTSVDVPFGTCYGQTDVPLKSSFEEEARAVKSEIDGVSFDKVYTSPLSRCVKLAEYCGFADAVRDERIKEICLGDWEMKLFTEIDDPKLKDWYEDYMNTRPTNGESFMDQLKRVSAFFDELKQHDYANVLLFAHGGVQICAELYTGKMKEGEEFDVHPYGSVITVEL